MASAKNLLIKRSQLWLQHGLTINKCLPYQIILVKNHLVLVRAMTKTCKKKIDIEKPHSVAVYNKFMGGVDKADMLLSFYCKVLVKKMIPSNRISFV